MDIPNNQFSLIDTELTRFLRKDRDYILGQMQSTLNVELKTSRRDLVTNIDKENQKRIIKKLQELTPDAAILAEENQDSDFTMANLVWVVDPIDGTMNFVQQQSDFAVMIGLYQDGVPVLGYIYDVMQDILIHGGTALGAVYQNENVLSEPLNRSLFEGLIGISGPMLINNDFNLQIVEKKSLGARVLGSAGIEFIKVIQGKQIGYISRLKPWDFAAGNALVSALGMKIGYVDGAPINMLKSGVVLVATNKAFSDIIEITE